ncbi:MAG TPA: methyl-coenzyme M reductase subunit beta [Candidatus Syntrophoarchaeum butanivorans]|uniref:coenzyme-B sulfoethylthiotransferase n=1 Tax=Candidatus Syntropharchaeum butanivorans TaxID=1839936 RepID=A0A1F2P3M1_9EURY|nr:MAG: methyl coenzyme M reductase beta subunit [Candidatus Syntrophoarchaeum butanivorans]HDM36505.1 methyl-coenzyme M reductase subunit beta [Candidatus Syntrophoarchaeum butanivorans]HEC57428.1 methyl-coenzyme M reductase subunit beta [Candidatus Syntrophoarchaeum butanivorans]
MKDKKETIDLYDEEGKILAEDIPLQAISPLRNRAIRDMIMTFKRSAIINLKKAEHALKTGALGSEMGIGEDCQIPGCEMDLDIVANAGTIADMIREWLQVEPGDDTVVELIDGGEMLFVLVPKRRVEIGSDLATPRVNVGIAVAHAIIEIFGLTPFTGTEVIKAAIFGRYPQSISAKGALSGLIPAWPPTVDGVGLNFRTNMVNDIVAMTNKDTMNGVALSSILEHVAMFDSGDAIHPAYERYHLLGLAFQGLNADNLVYDLVKENAVDGTIGSVIVDLISRAEKDGVISVKETLPSGFKIYKTDDASLWNAYLAAGQLASVIINCGAMRAAQGVPASMVEFNDMIKLATGLPDIDYGRGLGTSIGVSFYSHNIYGGAGPGAFSPANPLLRHCRGFLAPCFVAAMCLDAGTQMFTPELTSSNFLRVRDVLPEEIKKPIRAVAEAALELKGKL